MISNEIKFKASKVFFIKYGINHNKNNTNPEFGIDVFNNGKLVKSIPSISEDKNEIERILSICNELNLELCQLDDIIEDYLTDFSI